MNRISIINSFKFFSVVDLSFSLRLVSIAQADITRPITPGESDKCMKFRYRKSIPLTG